MSKEKTLNEHLAMVKRIADGMVKFQEEMKKLGIKCDINVEMDEIKKKEKK